MTLTRRPANHPRWCWPRLCRELRVKIVMPKGYPVETKSPTLAGNNQKGLALRRQSLILKTRSQNIVIWRSNRLQSTQRTTATTGRPHAFTYLHYWRISEGVTEGPCPQTSVEFFCFAEKNFRRTIFILTPQVVQIQKSGQLRGASPLIPRWALSIGVARIFWGSLSLDPVISSRSAFTCATETLALDSPVTFIYR